ncbi:AraC family transcriptional regulator [uncultured Pseudoalteromonas sp.]|uniref:helix-turn-helix transcriptional regulator n=1 Tax=uncultured Pseudoalteromonas sp. TaxID=114053 RepID=UPI00258B1C50|nr:AraC family transcriptional regulator [uncultured Pseudoalteromonas sp.]
MNELIEIGLSTVKQYPSLPFSIYCANDEQHIVNVPIANPLLVVVLSGSKTLIDTEEVNCDAGNFVLMANTPQVAMRNIPQNFGYIALLIEFDYTDFECLKYQAGAKKKFITGQVDSLFKMTLKQFIEWAAVTPPQLWPIRRQELLQVLFSQGFKDLGSIIEPPTLTHKVHTIIASDLTRDWDANSIAATLAMSESTLRRKLTAEDNSFQLIKDNARLSHGLHLIQSSSQSIGTIAQQCGFSSQSRFTDKFKLLFNTTPTALRKTIMSEAG